MNKAILIKLICIASSCPFLSKADDQFDYEHQEEWAKYYPECDSRRQSPIDIRTANAIVKYDMPEIRFDRYDSPMALDVSATNNGHTISLEIIENTEKAATYDNFVAPKISSGPFAPGDIYIVESLHFHWGSADDHGSEHAIDHRHYTMEMHILHRNTKYNTSEEAKHHNDGLGVLAVLYEVAQPNLHTNFTGFEKIIEVLPKLEKYNTSTKIIGLSLADLMKSLPTSDFFTYEGSLTTPPCSTSVIWVLFSHTVKIEHKLMEPFRKLLDSHNHLLEDNDRVLQKVANRKVILRKDL